MGINFAYEKDDLLQAYHEGDESAVMEFDYLRLGRNKRRRLGRLIRFLEENGGSFKYQDRVERRLGSVTYYGIEIEASPLILMAALEQIELFNTNK